ncbi:MAG: hypothetical protein H7Y04_03170, partial [Verrucomicrobia bacterium]|nr:hypothetical protein [Cytophagales bacterium]
NFSYSGKPFRHIQFISNEGQVLHEETLEGSYPSQAISVEKPSIGSRSFAYANHLPLAENHKMLMTLMFPEAFPIGQRFSLQSEDYALLQKYLSIFPRESKDPTYDTNEWYDSVYKFFLDVKNHSPRDSTIRCFNKVGIALGFLTDCTYFVDYENKVEYFVSATIYVNKSGNVDDGSYEYFSTGYPFFANLGRILYEYEKKRERKYKPKLETINYE